MNKDLHIVMHDVPWPVDFGGVTDLFWKLKTLSDAGVNIHLHCFTDSRPPQPYLEQFCTTVRYYPRKKWRAFSLRLPFIVSSRRNSELIKNLQKDNNPVLIEGVHCSYPLFKNRLPGRKVVLRLHNVEYSYYRRLAVHEANPLKRLYFRHESMLLRTYEKTIALKAPVWTVSEADAEQYSREFGAVANFLPVFLPWQSVKPANGFGKYCLYHGNLAINENEKAAEWLINEIFCLGDIPLIIAGHAPSSALKKLVEKSTSVRLIADPDEHTMQQLIEDAQVNVLPSFNETGVKLKLLNALFNGRHCLVNHAGVAGSGLDDLCVISDDKTKFREEMKRLFAAAYSETEAENRNKILLRIYNNEANARQIIAWLS